MPKSIGPDHRWWSYPDPELDLLSNIINEFNDLFGNIEWEDSDRIHLLVTEEIPLRVAQDTAFRNALQRSDPQNTRIEHDKALERVMTSMTKDDMQLFRQFIDNDSFKRWMTDAVYVLTSQNVGAS